MVQSPSLRGPLNLFHRSREIRHGVPVLYDGCALSSEILRKLRGLPGVIGNFLDLEIPNQPTLNRAIFVPAGDIFLNLVQVNFVAIGDRQPTFSSPLLVVIGFLFFQCRFRQVIFTEHIIVSSPSMVRTNTCARAAMSILLARSRPR